MSASAGLSISAATERAESFTGRRPVYGPLPSLVTVILYEHSISPLLPILHLPFASLRMESRGFGAGTEGCVTGVTGCGTGR